jgi:hypothetical protein
MQITATVATVTIATYGETNTIWMMQILADRLSDDAESCRQSLKAAFQKIKDSQN